MNKLESSKVKELEKEFDRIERETPSLKPIADAFREVLLSRAVLKSRIQERPNISIAPPDAQRFSEGVPLLTSDVIASFIDPWGETVESTLAPLMRAFPGIEKDALPLKEAFQKGEVSLEQSMDALMGDREGEISQIASRLAIEPSVLRFLLSQILKPFVEKRTEGLNPLIQNLLWQKGYCPICGYPPELSFIQGEGQRWLRCSLCGHQWRFDRMKCPSCGDSEKPKELTYAEGRDYEWAEMCSVCKRYVVATDLRKRKDKIRTEVVAIGMVYLDIVAQGKGYSPLANCAWNQVIKES